MSSEYSEYIDRLSDMGGGALAGIILGLIGFVLLIIIVECIFLTMLLKKANHEHPWAAWVPIYRQWVWFQVSGLPGWLGLILAFSAFIPGIGSFVSIALTAVRSYKFSRVFGKDVGYAIGLFFLEPIFLGILACGKSEYIDPYENNLNN